MTIDLDDGEFYGDTGEFTADQKLAAAHRINEYYSERIRRLESELSEIRAEASASRYGELTYRKMLEKGRSENVLRRVYVAIFRPKSYGS